MSTPTTATTGIEPAVGGATPTSRRRTSSGTGLGLALVDTITRAHHGELRLCSHHAHHRAVDRGLATACAHPATGTTVTLLLPTRTTTAVR